MTRPHATTPTPTQRRAFAPRLLGWFRRNARDLPWRRNRSPYTVLVSELMLQQTTVATVIPYYERFVRELPDWASLARARQQRVLALWAGLGYYRRARLLHEAARRVVAEHDGQLPGDLAAIRELPGVGPYTAGAVASLAFGLPEPAVDGNVARVLSRWTGRRLSASLPRERARLEAVVRLLMPPRRAAAFTEALMELGAVACLPRSPTCGTCPVASTCVARRQGRQAALLPRTARPEPRAVQAVALVVRRGEQVLLRRVPTDAPLLAGLFELPGGFVASGSTPRTHAEQAALRALGGGTLGSALGTIRHVITHRRVTLHLFEARLRRSRPPGCRFEPMTRATRLGLTAATAKALTLLAEARPAS